MADTELAEVADFLAGHAPFAALPEPVLRALPRRLTIRYHRRGAHLMAVGVDSDDLYIVRSGAIEIRDADGVLVDRVAEGATAGSTTLVGSDPSRFDVVAIEDTLALHLPREVFHELSAAHPAFADHFDAERADRLRMAADQVATNPAGHAILRTSGRDLVRQAGLVTVPADATICEAAVVMSTEEASSVLVLDGHRIAGILTDRDLRRRVVARGIDLDGPVVAVMTRDPVVVPAATSAIELLLTMTERGIHHLPLVEGLTPRLLSEYGITPVTTPVAAFTAVIEEIAALGPDGPDPQLADLDPATTALGFGQYLAALGLLTDEQEATLHADMVRAAAERGMTSFAFKPHPAAPATVLTQMAEAAAAAGVELRVLDAPAIAEVLVSRFRPALVVGSFSTALATARAFYDRPIVAVGTELLLESITPFQNSNRVPASLVHELSGEDAQLSADRQQELRDLIDTVSYTMQPELLSHLRPRAEAFLSSPAGPAKRAHFKRLRLTRLDLPGGIPPSRAPRATVRRLLRSAVSAVRTGRVRLRAGR